MACATLTLMAGQASAATFTPADVAGLVAAINTANTNGEADTIDLGGHVFTLTVVDNILDGPNGLPAVLPDGGSTLTIRNGTIERAATAPPFRLLRVGFGSTLALASATMRAGFLDGSGHGAAVLNRGTLSVVDVSFRDNRAYPAQGGAIQNYGTLTVADCTFSGNSAFLGGAIGNEGALSITGSAFTLGWAEVFGGALFASGTVSAIQDSTFSDNEAARGGAVYVAGTVTSIRNCTFSGNLAGSGSGLYCSGTISALTNATFALNRTNQGGSVAIEQEASITTIESCIIATSMGFGDQPDLVNDGTVDFAAFNLVGIGDGSGLTNGADGNQVGSLESPLNPLLGPLTANGGPTFTHAPLTGSPAIDAGSNPAALENDQRGPGFSRVSGAQADVGAFELQSADVSVTKVDTPDPVTAGEQLTYTIAVQNAGPDTATTVGLSDTLPAGTTFVSLSAPGGWSCTTPAVGANGTVGCSIAAFPAGSATFTIVVTVDWLTPVGTVLWNAATLYSVTPDPDSEDRSATVTTTVVSPARLSATKAVSGSYRPGGTVTYAIDLRNAGPGMQLDNPGDELVDVLPAELALVSASANSGTVVATVGTNTVTWNGTLVAGGVITITIRATVRAGTLPGASVTNQASIAFDLDGNGTNEALGTSDDPATTTAGDPTTFVALAEPAIPAVGDLGLGLFGLLVALGGALAARRRIW